MAEEKKEKFVERAAEGLLFSILAFLGIDKILGNLGERVFSGLFDGVKKNAEQFGDEGSKRVKLRVFDAAQTRVALTAFFVENDFLKMRERQKSRYFCARRSYGDNKPYEPGDEDDFNFFLGQLYMYYEPVKGEKGNTVEEGSPDERIKVFKKLDDMDDETFDITVIEALRHDTLLQHARKIGRFIEDIGKTAWGKIVGVAEETADPAINPTDPAWRPYAGYNWRNFFGVPSRKTGYLPALSRQFLKTFILAVITITLGVIAGQSEGMLWKWIALLPAISLLMSSIRLAVVAAPPGIILSGVSGGGWKGSVGRYINFVFGLLAVVIALAMILIFLPINNKTVLIPVFLISFLSWRICAWTGRSTLAFISAVVLFVCIFGFFFPLSFDTSKKELLPAIDNGIRNTIKNAVADAKAGLKTADAGIAPSVSVAPGTLPMLILSEEEAARGFTLAAGMRIQTINARSIEIDASQEYLLIDTYLNEYRKPAGHDRLVQSVPGPLTIQAVHNNTFFKIRRS